MTETLSSFLAAEANLISEAAEALPHQFSSCTYALGHIRQAVYLCITCNLPRGICSSCSIACHTDHEQIELFPKRNFRCDCPTEAFPHPCVLHKHLEATNSSNCYGQNFEGKFCRCGRLYDAKKEQETMIQCIACEDWYHESCLNLRERPPSRSGTPIPSATELRESNNTTNENDATSEASSSDLPPALLVEEAYDSLICSSCVLSNPTLRRWAGTKGVIMVTRKSADDPWIILDGVANNDDSHAASEGVEVVADDIEAEGSNSVKGIKRPYESISALEDYENDNLSKKARLDSVDSNKSGQICLAPPVQQTAQKVLINITSDPPDLTYGSGDIFLTEGWRDRWCRCNSCLSHLQAQPYLLEEEEIYEPPEDPDSGFSLEELGMRALERLPRDRAIDGIRAFNEMRDDLMMYLRPFAEEGRTVRDEDIRGFFEARMEAARKQNVSS